MIASSQPQTPSRWRRINRGALLALVILVPAGLGFGAKFIEFIHVLREAGEGAFAIAPIVNYLLASAGFLLMFGWAAAQGMFRDVERPKYDMLANEARLDRITHGIPGTNGSHAKGRLS